MSLTTHQGLIDFPREVSRLAICCETRQGGLVGTCAHQDLTGPSFQRLQRTFAVNLQFTQENIIQFAYLTK